MVVYGCFTMTHGRRATKKSLVILAWLCRDIFALNNLGRFCRFGQKRRSLDLLEED